MQPTTAAVAQGCRGAANQVQSLPLQSESYRRKFALSHIPSSIPITGSRRSIETCALSLSLSPRAPLDDTIPFPTVVASASAASRIPHLSFAHHEHGRSRDPRPRPASHRSRCGLDHIHTHQGVAAWAAPAPAQILHPLPLARLDLVRRRRADPGAGRHRRLGQRQDPAHAPPQQAHRRGRLRRPRSHHPLLRRSVPRPRQQPLRPPRGRRPLGLAPPRVQPVRGGRRRRAPARVGLRPRRGRIPDEPARPRAARGGRRQCCRSLRSCRRCQGCWPCRCCRCAARRARRGGMEEGPDREPVRRRRRPEQPEREGRQSAADDGGRCRLVVLCREERREGGPR